MLVVIEGGGVCTGAFGAIRFCDNEGDGEDCCCICSSLLLDTDTSGFCDPGCSVEGLVKVAPTDVFITVFNSLSPS